MKVAAIIEYNGDEEQVRAAHAVHREYLRKYLDNEQLRAAGPFAGACGALWVLEVETLEEAEEIVKGDPYHAAGIVVSWQFRSFAYWSAKEAVGA